MISVETPVGKYVYVTRHSGEIDRAQIHTISASAKMAFFAEKNGIPVQPAELSLCYRSLKAAVKSLIAEYELVCDDLLELLKYYRKLHKYGKEKEAFKAGHFKLKGYKVPPVDQQV